MKLEEIEVRLYQQSGADAASVVAKIEVRWEPQGGKMLMTFAMSLSTYAGLKR